MEKTCVVFVTADSTKTASRISNKVLKQRLAACVNTVKGISSEYWWKGRLEKAREMLLIMKTRASLAGKLTAEIRKNHPYSVPEIIFLDIKKGNRDYLKWIAAETQGAKPQTQKKAKK